MEQKTTNQVWGRTVARLRAVSGVLHAVAAAAVAVVRAAPAFGQHSSALVTVAGIGRKPAFMARSMRGTAIQRRDRGWWLEMRLRRHDRGRERAGRQGRSQLRQRRFQVSLAVQLLVVHQQLVKPRAEVSAAAHQQGEHLHGIGKS